MRVKNILIKVSGDLVDNKKTFAFIKKKAEKNFVVILIGGGTEISKALAEEGIKSFFTEIGRVITTFKGRQIARDILEQHQKKLQDRINEAGITAVVEVPVINLGSVLCHINGDKLASFCSINNENDCYLRKKVLALPTPFYFLGITFLVKFDIKDKM